MFTSKRLLFCKGVLVFIGLPLLFETVIGDGELFLAFDEPFSFPAESGRGPVALFWLFLKGFGFLGAAEAGLEDM